MSEEKLKPQTFEDWVKRSPDVMALMYLKNKIEELKKDGQRVIDELEDQIEELKKDIEKLKRECY